MIPRIKKEKEWAFNSHIEVDGQLDIAREISFEAWGVDEAVRARKAMKTARPKAAIAPHHINSSRIVANDKG